MYCAECNAEEQADCGCDEETTHTPGPWAWCADGSLCAREGAVVLEDTPSLSEADASLIAEAPAMLALLEEIAAARYERDRNEAIAKIARLVARARGF